MQVQGRRSRTLAAAVVSALTITVGAASPASAVPVATLGPTNTPADLASVLAGTGVTIGNVTYTGSNASAGSFTSGTAAIGFASGVVLSTGDAAIGSSNTEDTYTGLDGASGSGDADLDSLGAGTTMDTTVLEFDVTPNQGTLYFNYVFASDEYNEWVDTSYNDVFGFFVTQTGSTSRQNCAVLPDGSDADAAPDPVSIDTINSTTRPELFRNNDLDDGGGGILAEPDGFTTVLQCVATVTPNQVNHLKLAISDVGDSSFDSWVFIQAGSVSTVSEVCGDGIDNDSDGQVDEGCVVNQPPTVSAAGPYAGNEGSAVAIAGTVSDPNAGDTVTTTWSYAPGAGVDPGATCVFGNASALSTTVACTDDGTYTLTLSGSDGKSPAVTSNASLTVSNVAPTTSISAPADLSTQQVGSTVSVSANQQDAGSNDTVSCTISWGDGTTAPGTSSGGVCSGSHVYTAIGTYDITVTVTDDEGASGSDSITVVLADADTKVTGGGFVVTDGRYSFGFVAKPGSAGPEGQLALRTHANKHRFHGDTVSSLTVAGNTATWSGSGRYDNASGYTFTVTVTDNGTGRKKGSPDMIDVTVRAPGGAPALHFSGPIKGGNITVH